MKPQTTFLNRYFFFAAISLMWLPAGLATAQSAPPLAKPVLLYSQYYNAPGENRYPADGAYSEVLKQLREDFDVRVHSRPLTPETLENVRLVLIANANDKAVSNNPAPPHVSAADIATLTRFVERGGGLIVMQNQENHNVEIEDMNKLLARFGVQTTNVYTDGKLLTLPKETPIIGGLRWAYVTGNQIRLDASHPAKPRAIVMNDLNQKPINGKRDEPGVLLAGAEPGKGRVLVSTDSGWIINAVFNGEPAGGVVFKEQDNLEIVRRLTRWAAQIAKP